MNSTIIASTIIILSISIISNIEMSDALQFIDTRENYIGFKTYTGNRLNVFNDNIVDFCITTTNPAYQQIAINAVNYWHESITKVTNNSELWNIRTHIFPYNEDICDGRITYKKVPDLDWYALRGVFGISDPYQPVANVTIYTDFYQDTLRKTTEKEWKEMTVEKFRDIINNGTHTTWNNTSIERVTLHELGHAFNLNHPCESDSCNIYAQKGIMSYNMSETKILEEEVKNIVFAYPNGFIKNTERPYSKLNDISKSPRTFYVGQTVNFQIEFPITPDDLKYSDFTILIYPNNTSIMPKETAPIRFASGNHISNNFGLKNNEYIKDFYALDVSWIGTNKDYKTEKYVISSSFVGGKEMNQMQMIVILQDQAGFKKQFNIDTPFVIKNAPFSDIILDNKMNKPNQIFRLSVESPNNIIEKKYYAELKAEKQYYEELKECLHKKNGEYCTSNTKLTEFKIN
ncbi:MAG: hypothetical protein ACE5RF_07120 [Nitrosarchaeum sp.]